jgi:histidinol-phosphate aminotransferase
MITRRSFGRRAAALAGAVSAWTEATLAQRALIGETFSPNTVWLNANENPDGPCRAAIEAMNRVVPETWRYHYPEFREFNAAVARSERLDPEQIIVGAGSTEVLNVIVAAFTSATRPLITPVPTFEVPAEFARALGHKWVRVPLTSTYAADVKRLAQEAASAGGGLIYLCNPNNPTSSMTPKADLAWLVSNLPPETVLLVDEAYLHFVENYEQESALPWVKEGKNVIVTRTFSKIYGMAGLRVGFGCGRPDLIGKVRPFRNNAITIVGARAVLAALSEASTLIPQRRARLLKVRSGLCEWLRERNLRYIEPHANFIMIDVGMDSRGLGLALLKKDVAVGRPFPPLDKMLRVSIGTEQDMAKFRQAFAEVYTG